MLDKAQKAFDYYENGEKLKAVKIFEQLIIEYPNSENYGRNLYNIPTIYQEIGDNELAIKWYLKILDDEKIKDFEEDYTRGIFETNTNFKHYASTNIGIINYNIGNYNEALEYYKLANTKYPYYNTSGTDLKLNKIKIALNISDCYLKLNKINNAIIELLPHAFSESPRFKNFATEKILKILIEYNQENEFKKELENSFNSFQKTNSSVKIIIYNTSIFIDPFIDENLSIQYFKETELYKKLNE